VDIPKWLKAPPRIRRAHRWSHWQPGIVGDAGHAMNGSKCTFDQAAAGETSGARSEWAADAGENPSPQPPTELEGHSRDKGSAYAPSMSAASAWDEGTGSGEGRGGRALVYVSPAQRRVAEECSALHDFLQHSQVPPLEPFARARLGRDVRPICTGKGRGG